MRGLLTDLPPSLVLFLLVGVSGLVFSFGSTRRRGGSGLGALCSLGFRVVVSCDPPTFMVRVYIPGGVWVGVGALEYHG